MQGAEGASGATGFPGVQGDRVRELYLAESECDSLPSNVENLANR